MKRLIFSLFVFVLLLLLNTKLQAEGFSGKLDYSLSDEPRFIGQNEAGLYTYNGLNLYVNKPFSRGRFLALEYLNAQTGIPEASGLILTKERLAFGFGLDLRSVFGLRMAFTDEKFFGDSPYTAFGLYPYISLDKGELEIGREKDHQDENSNEFTYFYGGIRNSRANVYFGFSEERIEKHYGPLVKVTENRRLGTGILWQTTSPYYLFTGGNYNTNTEKPTWVFGFSRNASLRNDGVNPATFFIYRKKPETNYAMVIFTLWGKGLNKHMTEGLFSTFNRGGLKSSRVIGGRNIDQPGVGGGYESKDFGLVSLDAIMLSIDTGMDTKLTMKEVSGYLTYPENFGSFVRPYVGFAWREFSDLIYNMGTHQLTDPLQNLWEFKIGTKFKLWEEEDPRNKQETGYLRINLVVNTNGGFYVKSSLWF